MVFGVCPDPIMCENSTKSQNNIESPVSKSSVSKTGKARTSTSTPCVAAGFLWEADTVVLHIIANRKENIIVPHEKSERVIR